MSLKRHVYMDMALLSLRGVVIQVQRRLRMDLEKRMLSKECLEDCSEGLR